MAITNIAALLKLEHYKLF